MTSADSQAQHARALDGIQVLDLSHGVAGPYGARLLGDLGAEVIKVEKPATGDFARTLAPLVSTAPENEQSLLFQYLNWNKRGLTLDLRRPEARPIVEQLVRSSDIVVEAFRPGTLARWGFAPEQLFEWNPKLVLTSVTNFGQTGPYAQYEASDLVFQAMGGIMQISGHVDREPLKHGLQQTLFCAGLNVAHSTMTGLHSVARRGEGQHVDLSIHECIVSVLVMDIPYYTFQGVIQSRRQADQFPLSGEPIAAKNGYVTLQSVAARSPFSLYAELFNKPELLDPALSDRQTAMTELADWLRFTFEESVAEWDARELFLAVCEGRQLAGFVQTAQDLLECPHLEARNFWVEPGHPATGAFKFPGEFARLSETPFSIRRRSPLLGEHTDFILEEIGLNQGAIQRLRTEGVV
jgi:crotonobetainyl-CoA:carnitine CoA-transferase CaiB-like acyl-CoA transferase